MEYVSLYAGIQFTSLEVIDIDW